MAIRLDAIADVMHGSRMLQSAMLRYAGASWRLSSGSRIPTAAFDASGLTIGTKLQAQTRGWAQAQRNIQDGISAAQVADGAMDELSRLVGRIRELAVYSANGTLTSQDRQAIQDEVDQIRQNIDQVVQGTNFNNNPLLQGQKFQPPPEVDADGLPVPTPPPGAGYTGITVQPGVTLVPNSARATLNTQTGVYGVQVVVPPTQGKIVGAVPATTIAGAGGAAIDLVINGPLGSATIVFNHGDDINAMIAAVNAQTATTGVTAQSYSPPGFPADQYLELDTQGAGGAYRVSASAIPDPADPAPVVPQFFTGFGPVAFSGTGSDMTATINGQNAFVSSAIGSISFSLNKPGDAADGVSLSVTDPGTPGFFTAGMNLGNVNVLAFPVQINDLDMPIHSGPNFGDEQSLTIKAMNLGAVSLNDTATPNRIGTIDLTTQAGAQAAIDVADAAVNQIGQARGVLGADVNALQNALDVASTGAESQSVAQSRVMDADVAADAAELAKAQIVQQTATAAIAHSNMEVLAGLKLITDSRIAVASGAPAERAPSESGTTTDSSGSSPAPAPAAGSGSSPAPAMTFGGSGGSGLPVAGSRGLPGAGGFTPLPISAGAGGFTPLPVIGSGGGVSGPSGLSLDQMASMISNSLS